MHKNPRSLLSIMATTEATTGVLLLVAPSMLIELLLGTAPGTPAGVTVTRVAAVALLALGLACWVARAEATGGVAKGLIAAMLLYNVGVVAILVLAWTSLRLFGAGLWPVVLAHIGLAAWCVACLSTRTLEEKRS